MSKKSKSKTSDRGKNTSSKEKAQTPNTNSFGMVASALILEGIKEESIDTVHLVLPPRLEVESFFTESASRIDAYLILWQEWPSVFSFSQLKKKNLGLLASGYQSLKDKFDLPIFVHFVSNDLPATTKLKGGGEANFHFANFISNEWENFQRTGKKSEEWGDIWSQLERASKLSDEQFTDFVEHCEFHFNYILPPLDKSGDADQLYHQVERLNKELFSSDSTEIITKRFSASQIEKLSAKSEIEDEDELQSQEFNSEVEIGQSENLEEKYDSVEEDLANENVSVETIHKRETEEGEEKEEGLLLQDDSIEESVDAKVADKKIDSLADSSLQQDEDGIWSAGSAVKYIDTKADDLKEKVSKSEEDGAQEDDPVDLESLNSSYDTKEIDVEYVVNQNSEGEASVDPLDFKPDVKSVKDVRDKKISMELSSKNFLKIAQLKQKQEGIDKESKKVLSDAFDWYFSNANELFESEQYQEAEQDYRNALEKLVLLNEPRPEEEIELLENLGEVYIKLERPDLTVELYERAEELKVAGNIPIPKYLNALLMTGGSYEERGYLKDAEPYYRKAVEIAGNFLELNDPLVRRANEACLRLTKEKTNLVSRFSPGELERLKTDADAEKAIMHRKPTIKSKEQTDTASQDIWKSKEESPPVHSKRYSAIGWWLIALIPLAVLSFATIFYLKNLKTPFSATVEEATRFVTADQRKSMKLESSGVMTLYTERGNTRGTYRYLNDRPTDYLGLLVGHLRRKNEFLKVDYSDRVTLNEVTFYSSDSPEHQIVKYMWRYGKLAQLYRNEHGKYPDDVRFFKNNNRITSTYINPFTSKTEVAEIVYATGSNNINLPKMMASGATWKGQAEPRPGLIVCNNFEGSRFFIRGYGRDGELISSSSPGDGFFIELSYGENLTEESLKKFKRHAKVETVPKSIRYVFVKGSTEVKKIFPLLDAFIPTILAVLAIVPFLKWRAKKKKAQATNKEVFAFVVALTGMVLWYLIAFMDT